MSVRNLCFSIFGRESSTRVDTFNEFIHFRLLSRLDVLNAPTHLHNSMKMTCLWAAMSICAVIIVSCSHCYNASAVVVRLIGLKLTAARRRSKGWSVSMEMNSPKKGKSSSSWNGTTSSAIDWLSLAFFLHFHLCCQPWQLTYSALCCWVKTFPPCCFSRCLFSFQNYDKQSQKLHGVNHAIENEHTKASDLTELTRVLCV